MAREGENATKLARDLPKFGRVLKERRGILRSLGGNVDSIEMRWDLNELCKRDQVFELRVGDKRARISKQALEHFLRAV